MKAERAIFTYLGKVENGKLTIYGRETLKRDAKEFFDGMEVQLTLERKKRKRSNKQNRYYWGTCIAIIRDQLRHLHGTQYEPEEVHDFLKAMLNHERVVNEDTGEMIAIPLSTAKLSTAEMAEYIERVRQWSQDYLDTYIPEPNEQREMDFR